MNFSIGDKVLLTKKGKQVYKDNTSLPNIAYGIIVLTTKETANLAIDLYDENDNKLTRHGFLTSWVTLDKESIDICIEYLEILEKQITNK